MMRYPTSIETEASPILFNGKKDVLQPIALEFTHATIHNGLPHDFQFTCFKAINRYKG